MSLVYLRVSSQWDALKSIQEIILHGHLDMGVVFECPSCQFGCGWGKSWLNNFYKTTRSWTTIPPQGETLVNRPCCLNELRGAPLDWTHHLRIWCTGQQCEQGPTLGCWNWLFWHTYHQPMKFMLTFKSKLCFNFPSRIICFLFYTVKSAGFILFKTEIFNSKSLKVFFFPRCVF